MKRRLPGWTLGLVGILLILGAAIAIALPRSRTSRTPRSMLPTRLVHVDHQDIVAGDIASGQDVSRACLECHEDSASEIMGTTHWTWESDPVDVPWREAPVTIGKINQINNFCIGTQGNEGTCMSCHAGYAWETGRQNVLRDSSNVDCLVCHADPATYAKGSFGNPAEGVDLLAAARSVRAPTRENCGSCHFDGGGGNGVKHGDLDESLRFPRESLDVHMGGDLDFLCTDCHWTEAHQIRGRLLADNYTIDPAEQVACEQCHETTEHADQRVSAHLDAVACQTCHIPALATEDPTKVFWDWSKAGDSGRTEDHLTYLKIKGEFIYDKNFAPAYYWFNGSNSYRYLLGDKIDPQSTTFINRPAGSMDDPAARIYPFKVHSARQPYDVGNAYLLQPITSGRGGYWEDFDWDKAFGLAAPATGLSYSGQYGFAETTMYWPTTHMVQPADRALTCEDCHGEAGRLDWVALGYHGDPIEWGGRSQ